MKTSTLKRFLLKRLAMGLILGAPSFQTGCLPGCEREYESFQSLGDYSEATWSLYGAQDITQTYAGVSLHHMSGSILERKNSYWRSPMHIGVTQGLFSTASIRLPDGCELYLNIKVLPTGLINRLNELEPKDVTRSKLLEDENVLNTEVSLSYSALNSSCGEYSKSATASLSVEEVNESSSENWIVVRVEVNAQISDGILINIVSTPEFHITNTERQISESGDCS